jgi:tetratricopeptide (TPR) repeat protein
MHARRITAALFFFGMSGLVAGQMSPDLQKKVGDAVRQHRTDLAADYICEAAKTDASLQGTCTSNRQQVEVQLQKFEQKYNDGMKAVQEGRFDDAKTAFRTIYFGDYHDRAQDMLNKIPTIEQQARNNQQAADNAQRQDADDTKHMADGLSAFESGDFATAKSSFRNVQGNKKGDAQNWLNKINQYEQAMNEAQQAEAQKNYELAKQKYSVAASIRPNGPGSPAARISTLDTLLHQSQTQQATNRQSTPPPRPVEPVKPKVDVSKLLRDAKRLSAGGDTRGARKLYLEVLQAEPANVEALAGMEELNQKGGSSDVDAMLAEGIRAFYSGAYSDAEESLKFYLISKGSRVGLAKFYRGATKLTRFYLDPKADRSLYDDAVQEFKDARQVVGFTPPDAKYVSPKILKVYAEAAL